MRVKPDDTILFIGDSVTESGRDHSNGMDLGKGFPLMVATYLQTHHPKKILTFYNRGVGGEKLRDLKKRWEKDCLDLNPDIVSLMIGVNDTWHNAGRFTTATPEELRRFEADYRFLLKSLHQRTDARVILMEPFVMPYPKDRINWREDLQARIEIVRKMAREYHTELIPLDGLLYEAGIKDEFEYYTGADGVHPTIAGHGFIAQAWLDRIEKA